MEPRDQILDHGQDYDGIKEYDNPLPQWFVLMFYSTIVFAFIYMGYYGGKTLGLTSAAPVGQGLAWSGAVLASELRDVENAKQPFVAPKDHESLEAMLKNPGNRSKGDALFKANCVACHGEQGQGVIGPNLNDKFWIHGGKPENIVASITHGYPDKGMPAWEPVLGAEKVQWLTAYVMSLKGKSVENAKAPQGTEEDD